ncbi:MAG TPA: hypothetical protein VIM79_20500, partial [Niastella sp.]
RTVLLAQQTESPGSLPQLLPLTPEAASLIKTGLGNINRSSGAVQASIPLFELSVGGVKLPITLSYQSQGNKVEELCSRAGYGWTLNAGGVVTRNVMGMPDEKATRASIPANLLANTQEVLDYFENGKVSNSSLVGVYDTQPDEFSYNFNGHSGKFIINDAGTPEIITHENLKITVTKSGNDITVIMITTPDGVKYVFGDDAFERTQSDGYYKGSVIPKTSFLLRRILLTTGDNIQFRYTPIQTKSHTGFSESIKTPGQSEHSSSVCPTGHFIESRNFSFQDVTYNACYLSSIQTSTNVYASFLYEPMPDNSGDVRLKSFGVANQNGRTVCAYNFSYLNYNGVINDYPNSPTTITPGINGRFYLTKLYQEHFKGDGVPPEILAYDFDYYGDPAKGFQPEGSVYSQDHFGFANGANNQSLIPRPAAPDNFDAGFNWSNRNANPTYAMQGMLKKITYPTNGTEEFFYEPNTVMQMEMVPIPATLTIDVQGSGSEPYGAVNGTTTKYFTVYKEQDVTINLTDFLGSETCPVPCDICKSFYCNITDNTTGENLGNYTMQGLYPQTYQLHLQANHTYRVQVDVTGPSCFHGSVIINYDKGQPVPVPVNKITGGLRVGKIVKTDPVTHIANNTFFYYAALGSLNISSGVGTLQGLYKSESRSGKCLSTICSECGHNNYTSNGVYNLFRFDHSHVYYISIVQTDDAAFANGGIEYTYYSPSFGERGTILRGTKISFEPDGVTPDYNGVLKQTKVFDKNKQPKTIEEDNYESVSSDNIVRSIYIRKNYDLEAFVSPPDETPFWPFDVRQVDYVPRWLRLTSKRKLEYSDPLHSLETITTFTYGSPQNVLPASITTTNSKGENIRIERKYPTDYTSEPVLTAMQQNYNITPVIEESKIRVSDNAELDRTKTIYKDWFNDTKVIQPWKVQQKAIGVVPANMEDRIIFAGYDTKGNVIEVSKSQGYPNVYCWDFSQSLVTAEVKNAHADQIAYTSFEADSKGGWTYSGPVDQPLWVPTGNKMYNLSGGAITKSGLYAGVTYIVSYWSNNGAANVNGTTSIPGRQVKGWTFYEHTVSGSVGSITVSGSMGIDELRLYPQGALMTTFTYEPKVGVTSQCDADNRVSYYEYDDLNRLLRIRDLDNNILKQFDYQYKVEVNFTAQWQSTGATRCQPCAQNSNYPNGTQEHEEKDVNANSPTYGQTRWINDGIASVCAIQADWQLTGNTKCEQEPDNSGFLIHEEKDMNPCSSTYGNTRWLVYTMDCATCPRKANWQEIENVCEKDANNQNTGYHIVTYKDMETCSVTAGTTKTSRYYDPSGPCYVCTTGNCTGAAYKCINGKCEQGVSAVYSSEYTKETGVWKYKCTYRYKYSNCTWGDVTNITYNDTRCIPSGCD